MGNLKDYATSTILTPPSPATSGTTIVLQAGHGARFPAVPFMVTAHPPAELPTLDNAEKLEVTAKSTDTLTVLRAQGDTTAKAIEAGWRISNSMFLADIPVINSTTVDAAGATMNADTDVKANGWVKDEDTMSSNDDTKVPTQQSVKAYVDSAISAAKQAVLPVGSIVVLGVSTNPATLYGFGTWTAIEGKVLVGKAASGTFGTLDATGGTETVRQGFFGTPLNTNQFQDPGTAYLNSVSGDLNSWLTGGGSSSATSSTAIRNVGGTVRTTGTVPTEVRHYRYTSSTLQPYVVKHMWQRTA